MFLMATICIGIFCVVGGIMLTHRIIGPIFRLVSDIPARRSCFRGVAIRK